MSRLGDMLRKADQLLAPERKDALADWPWTAAPPPQWLAGGFAVGIDQAVGLPALLSVYRLLAGCVMQCPLITYDGDSPERQRATGEWQYDLLRKRPNSETTSAPFRADIAVSLLGRGNAYVRKFAGGSGRVKQMLVLDPSRITPKRENGDIVFEDRTEAKPVTRGPDEIIHFRTFATSGALLGTSPITACREAFTIALKRQRFEGAFYDNDATPPFIMNFPEKVSLEQAQEWLAMWDAEHRGVENKWRPSVAGGGAELKSIPLSFQDAQFVEAMRLTGSYIGALYQVPDAYLNSRQHGIPSEVDRNNLVTFALGPILTAMDEGFSLDKTLFGGTSMLCEHLAEGLLRASIDVRYGAYLRARQAGWMTANEIRARENMPPDPRGDELQATPVGGAPNDNADGAPGGPDGTSKTETLTRLRAGGLDLDETQLDLVLAAIAGDERRNGHY